MAGGVQGDAVARCVRPRQWSCELLRRSQGQHQGASRAHPGNSALLEAFDAHDGKTKAERSRAVPLPPLSERNCGGTGQGVGQFVGVGVIERLERITQWDPGSRRSFPNYVFDIAVLDLSAESETLAWSWIEARRDQRDRRRRDVDDRPEGLAGVGRNGKPGSAGCPQACHACSGTQASRAAPQPGSREEKVLDEVYVSFHGKKAAFEAVAAAVTARLLDGRGGAYKPGWLTRQSGDRGIDFVGRLEVGEGWPTRGW